MDRLFSPVCVYDLRVPPSLNGDDVDLKSSSLYLYL